MKTPEEATQMLLDTVKLLHDQSCNINQRIRKLEMQVDQLEEMNAKILFFLQTIMDDEPRTIH